MAKKTQESSVIYFISQTWNNHTSFLSSEKPPACINEKIVACINKKIVAFIVKPWFLLWVERWFTQYSNFPLIHLHGVKLRIHQIFKEQVPLYVLSMIVWRQLLADELPRLLYIRAGRLCFPEGTKWRPNEFQSSHRAEDFMDYEKSPSSFTFIHNDYIVDSYSRF